MAPTGDTEPWANCIIVYLVKTNYRLNNSITILIAMNCRPISLVNDRLEGCD